MKRNILIKDFYMEIWKSRGRFWSIFLIVALGVSFLSGLRASEPDMRLSADAYYDADNLMDIQIIGTLGLTDDDVAAIAKVNGIETVEAGYSQDVLCESEGKQKVLHVMSALESLNQMAITAGRMPKTAEECVLDADFLADSGYEVGDQITFISGNDDALNDTFTQEIFTIVGAATTSYYVSFNRGSTAIGNGTINGFAVVAPEAFAMDIYTGIYAAVSNAKAETAYTDAYDDMVEAAIDNIKGIVNERCELRRAEIVDVAMEEVEDGRRDYEAAKAEAESELADAQRLLDDGAKQIADGKQQVSEGWQRLEAGRAELASQENLLAAKEKELSDGLVQYQNAEVKLAEAEAKYAAESQLAEPQLAEAEQAIQAGQNELDQLKQMYDTMMTEPGISEETLQQAQHLYVQWETKTAELTVKREELAAARAQLAAAKSELDSGRDQLTIQSQVISNGESQIASGNQKIAAAWNEIAMNKKQLQENEVLLAEKEAELQAGQQELEERKEEAQKQLADAKQELADAKARIQDIKRPQWYVQNRSALADYDGFGKNADRMKAIAQVFPVLFFLVAALISLTTMTRMVEEQRTQIGTMKALGYGKVAIAGKYMGYAFFATLGGSIIGVLIGEKLFPFVIVTAYKNMYMNLPEVVVPYHISYALMATLAAMACTLGATWFACYKELRAQPAVLMRPPAPLLGKRVFIERVTFLWRGLTFTWKSTIRNLFRYKKRFMMTIFGIGSCMALMIVGFGIKDSIFQIAKIQYDELEHADATIYLDDDLPNETKRELYDYIAGQSDVDEVASMAVNSVTVKSGGDEGEVYLYIPEDITRVAEFLTFRDRRFGEGWSLPERGAILSEKMAKELDISVGDTITIEDKEQGDKEIEIAHICENYMGHRLYMSSGQYEELYGEKPYQNGIWYKLKEYDEQEVECIGEEALTYEGAVNVQYVKTVRGSLDDMLSSLNLVILVLIISAGMLAFVVLYNLNNINITERKRELATIKVLGFYDGEVGAYVYRENLLLTAIGIIAGLILGKILHQFIIVTVEIDNLMFGRIIKLSSYVYSILWTIGFSLCVNVIMFFKLQKIDMIESLKSVE